MASIVPMSAMLHRGGPKYDFGRYPLPQASDSVG